MTKDKSKKNNVVLCPKYGAAHFESQDKCPKCNNPHGKGAVSEYGKSFGKVFDDLNSTSKDIMTTKKKFRPDSLVTIILLLLFYFCSCTGNKESEIKSSETIQDSIQNEQTFIHEEIDIPRTHLGITLGMPYDEAKRLLLSNVCKGLDEEVDSIHKGILVERRGDWLGDWENKYSHFFVEVFDDKVYSIRLVPQNNPAEVIEALKRKYPFNVEETEELRYHSNGLVSKHINKNYSCSNGKTEVNFNNSSYIIKYRDVKLKESKIKFWDEVETLSKIQQQEDINQQLSNY